MSRSNPLPALITGLTAVLAAPVVLAQTTQLSLNYGEIQYLYTSGETGAGLPFHIELTGQPDGAVEAVVRSHKATDVTLKRGTFGAAGQASILTYALTPNGQGGDVDDDGIADIIVGTGGGGPHVKVFDGVTAAGQPTSHLALLLPAIPRLPQFKVKVRLQPAPGAHVYGHPAHLFNQPAPGQALEAEIDPALLRPGKKVTIDFVQSWTGPVTMTTVVVTTSD